MDTNLKQFFRENPCYLIPIIIIAIEEDRNLLLKCYNSEKESFEAIQTARLYENYMNIYQPSDFPISINHLNQIYKIPERLAGFFLAKKEFFYKVASLDRSPECGVFDEEWLKKTFSLIEQKKIKLKNEELTKDFVNPQVLPEVKDVNLKTNLTKEFFHIDSSKSRNS